MEDGGLDLSGLGQGQMARFSELGNASVGSSSSSFE
jgi:hypothetical protein